MNNESKNKNRVIFLELGQILIAEIILIIKYLHLCRNLSEVRNSKWVLL